MSLRHAILVLLENKPSSGYDLVQHFREGIGHFWHATHQQVYQELKKLHAERWVQFEVESQSERPDKKVYRLTTAGRKALQAWFCEPVQPLRMRNALLVKLYGGQHVDPAVLIAELERHRGLYQQQLEDYQQLEKQYFAQDEPGRRRYRLPYLTLRRGIRYVQDSLDWLDETCSLLAGDRLPDAPVFGPGPAPIPKPPPRKPTKRGGGSG